jgi:SH3 domain protein
MRSLRLKSFFSLSVLLVGLYGFILIPTAMADIQYVSDLLIISVKDGQNPDADTIGYLRSATALEVLEETEELMHIQTEDGLKGWVRKKFIVSDKPKAIIIGELEQKIALLEDELETPQEGSDTEGFKKVIQDYKQEIVSLSAALEKEKKASQALRNDLKKTKTRNQQLLKKANDKSDDNKKLTVLMEENKTLKAKIAAQPTDGTAPMLSGNMKWFLIGGGVLLFGFLIGRSIQAKRSYRY